jgi:two-component system cell cycle sensor histidine kinase/response regulator CckA
MHQGRSHDAAEQHAPFRGSQSTALQLTIILASTLALMTLYEAAKTLLFPKLTTWGSHVITIALTSIVATTAASWVLRKLRQSEDSYRRLVEMSLDAVWVHRQGRIIIANGVCARLFGASSPDELVGNQVVDFAHPKDRDAVSARIQNRLDDSGPIRHYDTKYIRMDGSELDVEVVVCSIVYQGEAATLAMFHDISEQKRAEQKLRESEANLAAAQRIAHLGSWTLDLENPGELNKNPVRWSDEIFRILGYEVGQIEASRLSFLRCIHPADRDRVSQTMVSAFAEGRGFALEYRIVRPDGDERIIQGYVDQIFDEKTKKPLRFVGSVQDVTEQKHAEAKLAQMALIVESSDDAITSAAPDGTISSWNKGAERIYGYSAREAVGQSIAMLSPPDRPEEIPRLHERMLRGERIQGFETIRIRKGGQPIDVSLTISPVTDSSGRIVATAAVARNITAQKQAEEKLAHLALIVESSDDAITSATLEGIISSWNKGAERIYGYTENEMVGKPFTLLAPPNRVDEAPRNLARVRRGDRIRAFETIRMRKDGQLIDVSLTVSPVLDPTGKVIATAAVARDITAQKREEERSRRLAQVVDSATELISTGDLEGRITFMNQPFLRAVGWSEQEIIGKHFRDTVLSANNSPELREQIRAGIMDEDGWRGECLHSRKDGTDFPVYLSVGPLRDSSGRVIGNVGIVRDLTESKRAEERFYKAFHLNPEPITIATIADGRYLDVNESFLRITGYQREEVIGHTSLEVKFWERPQDRARLIELLRQQGSVRDLEITFRTKSDEQRIALDSADVIEVNGEECIIAILKDITERKALEKQLRQLQKMEAVGQLSGGIAHDFNNLLGVILGYSEILEGSLEKNSKLRKTAQEIVKAGQRAASLTRQLLAFSRQQVLEPKVLNLNTVVADTGKMLRRLIGEHIDLTSRLDSDLWQVKADQGQIEQVIMNLAVNARDAMPEGGKLIIETRNIELDDDYALRHPPTIAGQYVELIVTDEGMGMDAQTLLHIFEPFFTTKELGKGTGLGLATVYGVVKQSGGYVWVYSEPGIGSTFKIYLPRVAEGTPKSGPGDVVSAPVRGSETILLVEDEESLRTLTRTILEKNGYTVLEASGGKEAIEIARLHTSPIDLLLTDMVMPGMNGHAVAQSLALVRPGLKVVFMSGYSGFAHRGSVEPDDVLLSKPLTRDALLRKLHEVLHLQKAPVT